MQVGRAKKTQIPRMCSGRDLGFGMIPRDALFMPISEFADAVDLTPDAAVVYLVDLGVPTAGGVVDIRVFAARIRELQTGQIPPLAEPAADDLETPGRSPKYSANALRVLSAINEAGDEGATKSDVFGAFSRQGKPNTKAAFGDAWAEVVDLRTTPTGSGARTRLNDRGRSVLERSKRDHETDPADDSDLA